MEQETQKNTGYRTSDLYFAAYLRAMNVPFTETQREGKRVYFVFSKIPELRSMKKSYFNGTSNVGALRFANEIRNMKSLTHVSMTESDTEFGSDTTH